MFDRLGLDEQQALLAALDLLADEDVVIEATEPVALTAPEPAGKPVGNGTVEPS